ncbi:inorganic phosphate transporter [Methanosphaerula palustris]|uniref:Phosphate transporter n=1 Tax=Methanosphaerula palustris (strain ATCC BAA-1556 / DSM 19958 / E1-9c) TaxID=521011 RepID=B8GKX3_METPE|nr:inorganic phosphate transporter [Methanosphaerula palustris]ACL17269.1 phosphate transporter [Methanosphaerula palustris E1-9c]
MDSFLIAGIFFALLLNFVNGMNDAANAISTVIATRVLTPLQAVTMAAFFNLVGPLLFTTAVAKTVGSGLIEPGLISTMLILAAMISAVSWVFFTTHFGIPISSTHAMVGGLIGAALAKEGLGSVIWPSIITLQSLFISIAVGAVLGAIIFGIIGKLLGNSIYQYLKIGGFFGFVVAIPLLVAAGVLKLSGLLAILVFMVIAPSLGFLVTFCFGAVLIRLCRKKNAARMNKIFKKLQVVSSAFYSVNHGSNDAQHAMGVITALLVANGILTEFAVPIWVILISSAAISLGTFLGGRRVIETMGHKITKLLPYQGFCAETGGGFVLFFVTLFGIPVSSTHSITGSIMGIGATRGYSAVKWGVVREIVATWIITIPASATVAFCFYHLLMIVFG